MATIRMKNGIFISVRFREPVKSQALKIKSQLDFKGIPTFVVNVAPGEDIESEVVGKLNSCRLVLVMGTADYGVPGLTPFGTNNELFHILQKKLDFF